MFLSLSTDVFMCVYEGFFVCTLCARVTSPLSVSGISDYLSFLVGSVVSIATLLPSVSGEGLLKPLWVLPACLRTTKNAAGKAQHAHRVMVPSGSRLQDH